MNETFSVIPKKVDDFIDNLEKELENFEPIISPVKHGFANGYYIRTVFMPKAEEGKEHIVTSMVHNTTHAYNVTKGEVSVFSDNDGVQLIKAPFWGITTPCTRRVLHIHEDCEWTTFHRTDILPENDSEEAKEEAAKKVGIEILAKHENKKLKGHYVNNNFIPENKEINY